jgi:hypothetical protein
MQAAGRLVPDSAEVAAMPWTTNIVPARMSREELLAGLRWLCNRLYDPASFGERLLRQIERLGTQYMPETDRSGTRSTRTAAARPTADSMRLLRSFSHLGPAEAELWTRVRKAMAARPETTEHALNAMMHYLQARHVYAATGLWDPSLAKLPSPRIGAGTFAEPGRC